MAKPGGVFCFEGQWDDDLTSRDSVLPTLELLERLEKIRFIHRDTATSEELHYYIDRWLLRKYAGYSVGFFAVHGAPTELCLSRSSSVALGELSNWMADKCSGKKLFFSSCAVLRAPHDKLVAFLRDTGAEMLCGFTRQIDWIESAAFETVVLDCLVNGRRIDSTQKLMRSARWSALSEHLGFRIVYANGDAG